jgi:hypothetical protein
MPDSEDKREDVLNGKDIAQIDTTIISGALIFITVSSFVSGKQFVFIATIAASSIIALFALSLFCLVRPGKWAYVRNAKFYCMGGLVILIVVLIVRIIILI